MVVGSAVGAGISYAGHNYMMKNKWPSYIGMNQGMRAGIHGG